MPTFIVFQQKIAGRKKNYCRVLPKLGEEDAVITSDIYEYTIHPELDCWWSDLVAVVESTYKQCPGHPGFYDASLDNLLELIEDHLDDTEWAKDLLNPPIEELDQTIRPVCSHEFN